MALEIDGDLKSKQASKCQTIRRLRCKSQNYAWGRRGLGSEVAELAAAAGEDIDESERYAELWMGTHPNAPSEFVESDNTVELLALIRDYPEVLGAAADRDWGLDLPFLFKVLSVDTALSIQSHPDKKLAERLHTDRPDIYKDANHKPEMALAITPFEALSGFVAHEDLVEIFETVPELAECCGDNIVSFVRSSQSSVEDQKHALKMAFAKVMSTGRERVCELINKLCHRLLLETGRQLTDKETLTLRLQKQYPNDIGILSAWFLNLVTLQPGQAIALAANEPHAYVSGQLIECMATSDNVIRAGLTPKYIDVQTLIDTLTYSQGPPEVLEGRKSEKEESLKVYRPRFDEFEVWSFMPRSGRTVQLPASSGPLITLVQHGAGSMNGEVAGRGAVFFVPAGLALTFVAVEDMKVWFAACNRMAFDL